MRAFIIVIIIAISVGVITANRHFSVSAPTAGSFDTRVEKLRDLVAAPMNIFVPPAPPVPQPPSMLAGATDFATSSLSAQSALVIDHRTDTILFAKNIDAPRPLASITKLMTALIVLERIHNWSATTTVDSADVLEGAQTIVAGEVYTAHDILVASLIGSLNTATHVLVRLTGLTDTQFVAVMNERAQDLGMSSMHFDDVTGLSPNNVASARDVARLLKFTLSQPDIKTLSVHGNTEIKELKTNTKKIIKATDWFTSAVVPLKSAIVEGGKTGYIPESGYNFAVQFKNKNDNELRVVILGADTAFSRFTESGALADWAYSNWQWSPDK